jgi:hypothetical protein
MLSIPAFVSNRDITHTNSHIHLQISHTPTLPFNSSCPHTPIQSCPHVPAAPSPALQSNRSRSVQNVARHHTARVNARKHSGSRARKSAPATRRVQVSLRHRKPACHPHDQRVVQKRSPSHSTASRTRHGSMIAPPKMSTSSS